MRSNFIKIFFFIAVLFCSVAMATKEATLLEKLNNIKTFQAAYIQEIKEDNGNIVGKYSGTLYIKKPNKFLLQNNNKQQPILISDGVNFWNYDRELAQVIKKPISEVLDNTIFGVLMGKGLEQYKVSKDLDNRSIIQQHSCYRLEPKTEDLMFKRVTICFNYKGQLSSITAIDNMDQEISMLFAKIILNEALSDSLFVFIPDADVELID